MVNNNCVVNCWQTTTRELGINNNANYLYYFTFLRNAFIILLLHALFIVAVLYLAYPLTYYDFIIR